MSNLFGRAPGVSGANDIPPPASDDDKNVAPQVAVDRIADFVKPAQVKWPRCLSIQLPVHAFIQCLRVWPRDELVAAMAIQVSWGLAPVRLYFVNVLRAYTNCQEDPQALYTFDSRVNRDILADPSTELCRRRRDGGVSCVKVAVESKALFKTMQSLGFYCALPAMPTETHMECRLVPRSS